MKREADAPLNGFKPTEIGLIPKEWEVMALEKAAFAFHGGGTPSTNHPEYWGGDIHWTTSAYISGLHLRNGQKKITKAGLENSSSTLIPQDNLLIGTRVGVGKVAINQVDMAISQDLTGALIDKNKFHLEFLAYYLLSEIPQKIFQRQTRGTTIKGIPRDDLRLIPVCCPPLPEQRAIAHILSKIQAAAQAQAAIAGRARELKRALMAKLFTEGLRGDRVAEWIEHPLYGSVPKHWFVGTLGDLCKDGQGTIQTGPFGSQLHASDYKDTGVPVVNPTHLADNRVVHEDIPLVGEEDQRRLSKHVIQQGDILFGRRGEIGRHAFITAKEEGWLCGTGCFLVRVENPTVDNAFLSWFFYTEPCQQWLKGHAVGSIMPNLNTQVLRAIPVVLPPVEEQCEIARILQTVDAKITAAERKRAGLEELFRAMLGELMTGRVRVKS